jgi:Glu-tRNA(Gln) amidotransferase subunit E-like FAD-binding protein
MAQNWTDTTGRQWLARVTIGDAQRIKAELQIDLLDPEQLGGTFADPFRVVELLAAIHRDQITAAGLTAGDFVELATETAEVSNAAAAALEAALADFFRRLRRPALAAVIERAAEATAATEAEALRRAKDPRVAQAMKAAGVRELAKFDAIVDAAIRGSTSGEPPAFLQSSPSS